MTYTIAECARDNDVHVPLDPSFRHFVDDGLTIEAPGDHVDAFTGETTGRYFEGDLVSPFEMSADHLRIAETYRTPAGRISAQAERAKKELARRVPNRKLKAARHKAVIAALEDKGLIDWE
jgi:hypothetical protein